MFYKSILKFLDKNRAGFACLMVASKKFKVHIGYALIWFSLNLNARTLMIRIGRSATSLQNIAIH